MSCLHYTYPVLASDPPSFRQARLDPRACSYNQDMVLLWEAVLERPVAHRAALEEPRAALEEPRTALEEPRAALEEPRAALEEPRAALEEASVEQVFGDLLAAARHRADSSRLSVDNQCLSNSYSNTPSRLSETCGRPHSGSQTTTCVSSSQTCEPEEGCGGVQSSGDIYGKWFVDGGGGKNNVSRGSGCYGDGHHDSGYYGSLSKLHGTLSSGCTEDGVFVEDGEEFPEVFDEDEVPQEQMYRGVAGGETWGQSAGSEVKGWLVQCQNCQDVVTVDVARLGFKNCHNCPAAYCSRECRSRDWQRHKLTACHGSLVNSTCKQVIKLCSQSGRVGQLLSKIAQRGYMARGRGCVLMGFPDLLAAQNFLEHGVPALELKPTFVTIPELQCGRVFKNVLDMILRLCLDYDPMEQYVLNVGVGQSWNRESVDGIINFVPDFSGDCCQSMNLSRTRSTSFGSDAGYHSLNGSMSGTLKPEPVSPKVRSYNDYSCTSVRSPKVRSYNDYSCSSVRSPKVRSYNDYSCTSVRSPKVRSYNDYSCTSVRNRGPIIHKCKLLKLCLASLRRKPGTIVEETSASSRYGPTLILTGVPGVWEGVDGRKQREICFINIQRKLRHRGVILRHQFPRLYSALVKYVSDGTHFPAEIVFPVDTKAKKLFMCVLMPEGESELEWTQSRSLLDELGISKRSIWESGCGNFSTSTPVKYSDSPSTHVKYPDSPSTLDSNFTHLINSHSKPTPWVYSDITSLLNITQPDSHLSPSQTPSPEYRHPQPVQRQSASGYHSNQARDAESPPYRANQSSRHGQTPLRSAKRSLTFSETWPRHTLVKNGDKTRHTLVKNGDRTQVGRGVGQPVREPGTCLPVGQVSGPVEAVGPESQPNFRTSLPLPQTRYRGHPVESARPLCQPPPAPRDHKHLSDSHLSSDW